MLNKLVTKKSVTATFRHERSQHVPRLPFPQTTSTMAFKIMGARPCDGKCVKYFVP